MTTGPLSFWKGILPPIIANVPINALGFATYGNAKRLLTKSFNGSDSQTTIPTTPHQLQHDFYHNELFSKYSLPSSFTNQFQIDSTSPAQPLTNFSQFQSHHITSTSIADHQVAPNWWAVFWAGCWSGLLSCIICTPSELLKIQEQNFIGQAPSSWSIAKTIMSNHGPLSLYRGFLATVIRDTPSVGVYFWVYEYIKWALRKETWTPQVLVDGQIITPEQSRDRFDPPSKPQLILTDRNEPQIKINWQHNIDYDFFAPMIAGGIAGPMSWISTYPMDVIKTRLQGLSHDEYKKSGMLKVFRQIAKQNGYKFFATGLGTTVCQSVPVSGVIFLSYEQSLALCKNPQRGKSSPYVS